VQVTLIIAENTDRALSASHVVDVRVFAPLRDSPVRRAFSLVAKPSETALGKALSLADSDQPFRIALTDVPERVATNVRLLQEAEWFDLLILFDDGKFGILTVEKGASGEIVFNEVLREWMGWETAFPNPARPSGTPPLCASGVAEIRSGEKVVRYPGGKRELGGETILEFAGIDFPGADYQSLAGIPLANCVTLCRSNVNCQAYTYNTRASYCFLKSRWTEARAHADAHSGLKCSTAP
jgi:hypothetical protein